MNGGRGNPTYLKIKKILGVLNQNPKPFEMIRKETGIDKTILRRALYVAEEFRLIKKVKLDRSYWKEGSRPRVGWVNIFDYPKQNILTREE